MRLQEVINRERIDSERDYPLIKTFAAGMEFLRRNRDAENWLLQIRTFDPHESFRAPVRLRQQFASGYQAPVLDWPLYTRNALSEEETAELQAYYAALVAFCEEQLGLLLDAFDEGDLWSDTAIILTTDYGFLLGEHDWWGKNRMPFYNEIAHIPLIIYHPDHRACAGKRILTLTQTIDLMPTLLDFYAAKVPEDVNGRSIVPLLDGSTEKIRDIAIYGIYAGAVNATDGQYSYFRYHENMEVPGLCEYTLIPTHNYDRFEPRELQSASLHPPFDFTKGVPVPKLATLPDAKRFPRQGGGGLQDAALRRYRGSQNSLRR